MNEFKTYHPIVNFIYFVAVLGFSMFFMHPLCLAISFVCAFAYSVILKGRKAAKTNVAYMLPAVLVMALMNPAFNHAGVTILAYFPSGNPLTLESVLFGVCAAVMIVTVICWFSCYNRVMTSDKFIYLFGRLIPSLSLILSMTLRFVPKFAEHLKVVVNGQKGIGRDMSEGSLIKRAKCGITVLSIMITWALENSIETADSMKARGYGLKGRTAFSIFKFDKRDIYSLIAVLMLSVYVLIGGMLDKIDYIYFPTVKGADFSFYGLSVFVAYFALCVFPVVVELWEVRKWKAIKSKI